jgi:hypothetical protein
MGVPAFRDSSLQFLTVSKDHSRFYFLSRKRRVSYGTFDHLYLDQTHPRRTVACCLLFMDLSEHCFVTELAMQRLVWERLKRRRLPCDRSCPKVTTLRVAL